MRKLDPVYLSLLLSLAPTWLLAATAPISAIATGDCAVAVNASGQAVVTITASCDKQTAATVQKLLEQQAEQRRKNAQVDKRQNETAQDVSALQRQIADLTAAVKTIAAQAQQADASSAQKQAAANLRAGKPDLAIVQLGLAADKEAAASTSKAQNAAALYRQQAALLATRDVKQALAAYQKALALEPGDYATLWDTGDMAVAVGDNALALKLYQQMQQVVEQALRETPHSPRWQRELSVCHSKIGDILQAQGDGAAALQSYRASLAIRQKLAAQDPGNALWQVDLAKSQIKVANIETDAALQNKLRNQALTTLQALRSAGKLDAADRAWLEKLEAFFAKNPLKP